MRLSVTQNVAEVLDLLPGQWCIVAPQGRTGKQMRNNELPESLAWLPRGRRRWRGPELFYVPFVCKEPLPVYGEDHTHLTARETGSHVLRGAPDARGPHRHRESATLPANFDGQIYQSAQPPDGSPGGEDAMGNSRERRNRPRPDPVMVDHRQR